jgi:D-alanyl-D-alanine carboxypeptidase
MAFFRKMTGAKLFRALIIGFSVMATTLVATTDQAEAARRKKRGGGYSPPYAAMVVDVKTGRTLHGVNEDALRHPASITKVMTLYLMFEQIERGRMRMDTPLKVSSEAASQSPSKLGLEAGETISVQDAVMALITKSANDAAVVIAENIGGTEEAFAEAMTRKARSLGMSRTVYRNASGLPDPEQVTTARDLTILARAIQERFPRYYALFSTRSFNYAGDVYRNHNKLLGRIEGVDGIKTGYTRASGFNLMTSAKSDGRHVVAIVLGGRSGRARDAVMGSLVVANLPRAHAGSRTSPMIAEAPQQERARPAVVAEAPRAEATRPEATRQEVAKQAPAPQTAASMQVAAAPVPPSRVMIRAAPLDLSATRPVTASTTTPPALRWAAGAQPMPGQEIRPARDMRAGSAPVLRPPANVDITSSIAKVAEKAPEPALETAAASTQAKSAPAKAEPAAPLAEARPRGTAGWVIQLGATDDEGKARDILSRARTKAGTALSDASGFTEKVEKGGATLFRARFAGFDDAKDAESACKAVKRGGFACFAVKG